MKEYLSIVLSFLIGINAHHEVHLVPAHKICPDVTGDHDILLPDPKDCSVYYRCENGTAIPQSCPPGLAWCQILQNCTLPILANCTLSHTIVTYSPEELVTYNPNSTTENPVTGPTTSSETCPKDGASVPNPEDCRKYYKCKKGKPHSERCSGKKRYSTWLGICIAPEIANCINVGTQENKTCPVNGARNVYPLDCTQYYECVGNTVEIKQCPIGKEYNKWFKDCYSPELAYCHACTTLSPTTSPTTIQTPGPDNTCPGNGYKLPNPLNCTTYYVCENNSPTLQNCPAGFEYSCWDQECLPPSGSQCLPTQGQSCKNSEEKLPNSEDCHSYFECKNSTTVKKYCKIGLQYNSWFKKCVRPNVAHCKVEEPTTPTTSPNPPHTPSPSEITDICPIAGAKLPDPLDCHSYYICKNETPVQETCPQNMDYSCWDLECLPVESADCIDNINQTGHSCKTDNTTMPNIYDCSSYYKCENGKVVLINCDNGLEFNAWYGKCVNSSLSHCDRSTTENPHTTPTTPNMLCPQSGIQYPSSKYCNAYMICDSNRQLKTVECNPSTFHYNCETKKCENMTHCCSSSTETMPPPTGGSLPTAASSATTQDIAGASTDSSSETSVPTSISTRNSSEATISTGGSSKTTSSTSGSTGHTETTVPTSGLSSDTITPTRGSTETTIPTGVSNETTSTGKSTGSSSETSVSTNESTVNSSETTISIGESSKTTASTSGSTEHSETTVPTVVSSETSTASGGSSVTTIWTGGSSANSSEASEPTGVSTKNSSEATSSIGESSETTTSPVGSTVNSSETTISIGESSKTTATTSGSTGNSETTVPTVVSSETSTASDGSSVTTISTGGSTANYSEASASTGVSTKNSSEATSSTGESSETTASPVGSTVNSSETTISIGESSKTTAFTSGSTGHSETTVPTVVSSETSTASGGSSVTTISTGGSTANYSEASASTGVSTKNSSEATTLIGESSETTASPVGSTVNSSETTISIGESSKTTTSTSGSTGHSETTVPTDVSSETSTAFGGSSVTTISTGGSTTNSSEASEPTGVSTKNSSEATTLISESSETTASPVGSTVNSSETTISIEESSKTTASTSGSTGYSETTVPTVVSSEITSSTGGSIGSSSETSVPTSGTPPTILCPQSGIQYPSFKYCNAYMICDNNRQLVTVECNPSTFHYNCETKTCENITHCCSPTTETMPPPTGTTLTTIPSSSPSPSTTDDVCPSDGAKLPNPLDCTSYFICRNNTPITQHCPSGQEYSCWNQQCEDPKDAVCIDSSHPGQPCSHNDEKLPNIGDCGSYYQCVKGKTELKQCSSGKLYNKWFKKCVDASSSHCETYPTSPGTGTPTTISPSSTQNVCPFEGARLPNPMNCSTYFVCLNNEPSLESCPSGQGYSCWDQECELSAKAQCITNIHPGDSCSINNLLLPNTEDCRSYYKCQNGSTVTMKCPPDTQFNSWFQKCVKSKYAHCQPSTTSPSTPTTITTPHTTSSPSATEDVCPIEGAKLPNPLDCSSYFICINETAQKQQCPSGQEYSCWDQKCEKPENSTCIKEGSQEGQQCSTDGEKQQNVEDCGSYYVCDHGKIKLKHCSKGKFYNKWYKKCLSPRFAHCKTSPTIKPPYSTLPPPTTVPPSTTDNICPFEGALLPNPLNCSTYFTCINSEPTLESCPDGQGYSCWIQQCESGALDACNPNSGVGQSCSVDGLILPISGDCEGYLECINGTVGNKTCPPGTQFNSWFQKCVKAKYAHCQPSTTSPSTPTTITTPHTTPSPSATEDVCPIEGAKLPNPLDCSSYFICINETAQKQQCPPGQEYSCWDQKCEKPENSTCIKDGSQEGQQCSTDGEKQQNVEDCGSYYVCDHGKIKLKHCSKGKFYNKWFKKCLSPRFAHCKTSPTIKPPYSTLPPPTTISPSTTDNICPFEGALLPNPLNCSTYFTCINNEPTLESCPDGQGYSCWNQQCESGALDACNPNSGVGQSCSVDGLILPISGDCEGYLECINGTVRNKTCPPGKQYNSWFGKCIESKYSHCLPSTTVTLSPTPTKNPNTCPLDGAILPNPLNCNSYFTCEKGKIVMKRCPAGQIYSCWDQKCKIPQDGTCINQGHQQGHHCSIEGVLLPNIDSCSSYYQCIEGKIEVKFCGSGKIYNKWLKICVSITAEICVTYPTIPAITTPPGPTDPTAPSEGNNVCPIEGALIPNPLDCATYYKCIKGTPVLKRCPYGNKYSCWDQLCEPDNEATCVSEGGQNGKNCSVEGLRISDVTDCNNYYECNNGTTILKHCPHGEEFNAYFQKCYKPKLAHCHKQITITPKPPTIPPTISPITDLCPVEGSLLPNPLNCSTYYKCINYTPVEQLCADGYEYSCWIQECKPAGEAKCITDAGQTNTSCNRNDQQIQNPEDCHNYYKCVNGKVQEKHCPLNWYYNKWFHICVPFANLAHCKPTTRTVPPTTLSTTTPGPQILNDICPKDGILLPDPLDCSGYYICVNSKPISRKCPSGQEYSCWDQKCKAASDAQCINSEIQLGQNCSRDGVKLQNLENCYSYYECVYGKVQKYYCFIGFQYNRWYQKCLAFPYAHCKTYPIKTTTTTTPTTVTTTPTTVTTTRTTRSKLCPVNGLRYPSTIPGDCGGYLECDNYQPVRHQCPFNTPTYNCETKNCEFQWIPHCCAPPIKP